MFLQLPCSDLNACPQTTACSQLLLLDMPLSCFYLLLSGSRSGPSTADAEPTTTTPTSTTSTRGTPSSTRRRSVSTANTQQRSNRTWREVRPCRSSHLGGSLLQFAPDRAVLDASLTSCCTLFTSFNGVCIDRQISLKTVTKSKSYFRQKYNYLVICNVLVYSCTFFLNKPLPIILHTCWFFCGLAACGLMTESVRMNCHCLPSNLQACLEEHVSQKNVLVEVHREIRTNKWLIQFIHLSSASRC